MTTILRYPGRLLAFLVVIAFCVGLVSLGGAAIWRSLPTQMTGFTAPDIEVTGAKALAANLPAPDVVEMVTPATAMEINATTPIASGPLVAAAPFVLDPLGTDAQDRIKAIDCLTAAIYYEAASEGVAGQRAVAQVVLNRVRHPAFPNSVCAVVFQGMERSTGCQFTFTCDGALNRKPIPSIWQQARLIATQALSGYVDRSVGLATHYHTTEVLPVWRKQLAKQPSVGSHIFYRWTGFWGTRRAFSDRYAATEIAPTAFAARLSDHLLSTAVSLPLAEPVILNAPVPEVVLSPEDPILASRSRLNAPAIGSNVNGPAPGLVADERRSTLKSDGG